MLHIKVVPDTDEGCSVMKKTVYLQVFAIVVAAAVFSSCEKEDGGINGATGKTLVKISSLSYEKSYYDNALRYTCGGYGASQINWSNGKIVGLVSFSYREGELVQSDLGETFIYEGDLLTEMRQEEVGYQSNTYYTYSNGQVSEVYRTWMEDDRSGWTKYEYIYSDNGKLRRAKRTSSGSATDVRTYEFTWSGDNIVVEQIYENGTLYGTTNYTYDSKVSVFASVPKELLLDGGFEQLSANNVIAETQVDRDGDSRTTTFTYTYEGNYPVKCVSTSNGSSEYSSSRYESTSTTYFEYADGTGASQVPQVYSVNVSRNNTDAGYVGGDGEYAAGTTAVLYASPNTYSGYVFQLWSDGVTANPRTITVNGNASYVAIFTSGN